VSRLAGPGARTIRILTTNELDVDKPEGVLRIEPSDPRVSWRFDAQGPTGSEHVLLAMPEGYASTQVDETLGRQVEWTSKRTVAVRFTS
jgi:hypothetical protein